MIIKIHFFVLSVLLPVTLGCIHTPSNRTSPAESRLYPNDLQRTNGIMLVDSKSEEDKKASETLTPRVPAKTIFSWSIGPEEDKKEDEEPEEENPIVTDRPDFTEASSTVGKGRIQLEAGYTFFRDKDFGVRTTAHTYPEALFRIGLFADWFELRLGQSFANSKMGSLGVIERADGAQDFYFGSKIALTEQKKYLPESAVILQTTIPTGSSELTSDRLMPGINLLYGWDVIEDLFSIGGSTQGNRTVDENQQYYITFAQSLTGNYTITPKLGAYTE